MLESIRKQGASAFIYLIFGLLIAIFVINMGNGSSKGGGGCSGAPPSVLTLEGKTVNRTSYTVAFSSMRGDGLTNKQREQFAIERLIKREILAREAEKRGLRVSSTLVEDGIKNGDFYMAGERTPLHFLFDEHDDGDKTWNYKKYKAWVQNLNVSLNSYQEEQERELEAVLMADVIKDSVMVSRDEALQAFLFRGNTVTYDVVGFSAADYRAAMRLTEADVARFLAGHEKEVQARFKQDERLYDDKPLQLQLRQIFIAKKDDKKADDKKPVDDKKPADDKKPDDKKAEKDDAPGMAIDAAKAKLEAVRTAYAADKASFAKAAKDLNTDEGARALAGAIGWHTASDPQLAEKAVSDAVKTLKVGDISPVIATDRGAYVVVVEASREKKVTYDQAKLEIAQELARDVWSKEKAKRMAIAAFDKAHAGAGQNLGDLFEKVAPEGGPGGIDLNNLTPEQQEQLRQLMQQQHGSLHWESKDHLAAWTADKDGAGGGSGSGSGEAKKAPAPTAGKPIAVGTGSGSGAAPSPTPDTPVGAGGPNGLGFTPPTDALVASTDELPAFADVKAPKVSRLSNIHRSTRMANLGTNPEAAKALFDELTPGNLAKRVYTDEDEFVVVQLIARSSVKPADFDKEADQSIEALRKRRGAALLAQFLKDRCEEWKRDDKIKADIHDSDEAGKPLPSSYVPCFTFKTSANELGLD